MSTTYSTAGFERIERDIAGVRTVAYVAGSGPDVVYLHGGGTWHGFEFARDWLSRFRVTLPYHPNYGESADAPAMATVPDYALHYASFLDALGLGVVHLAGASMGGRIAAEFAASHPDRTRSLVLVSPIGVSTPGVPEVNYSAITYDEWPGYFAVNIGFARRFWPNEPDAAFVAGRVREGHATVRAIGSIAPEEPKLRQQLQRIRVPTLLLWGREDRMVPSAHAATWQSLIPGSKVAMIERAGHLLLDESVTARQTVARFMRDHEEQ